MVTKFNTAQTSPSGQTPTATPSPGNGAIEGTQDNSDKIALFVLIGLIGLATWKFIIKPEMEKIRLAEESEVNKND